MKHPAFEKAFGGLRKKLTGKKIPSRIVFVILGILSTVWFLARVIPKPQRAAYPCMKAAFPLMTGFIIWILSITGSFTAFRLARKNLRNRRYAFGMTFAVIALAFGAYSFVQYQKKAAAADNYVDNDFFTSNEPMGEGKGIHPGRVVWVHDPDATDENCVNDKNDPYYLAENNDQGVIDAMVEDAVLELTGQTSVSEAWDAMFTYFNEQKGRGSRSYSAGEIIFIKINQGTASWLANEDLSRDYETNWRQKYAPVSETSPFTVMSTLRHLVYEVGVAQNNIYVADPIASVWKHTYEYLHEEFPDVNYGDKNPANTSLGRTMIYPSADPVIFYSDNGEIMDEARSDRLYEEMETADYLINIAALKAHARAGITLTAKNHFGSHSRSSASHLHPSLPAPENDNPLGTTVGYGKYRVFTDIMGHEKIGQNTLLYFVDGLWGGNEAVNPPRKFTSAPFNDDWSSSVIISQDQVALESVCFDILRTEYNTPSDPELYRPHIFGADDYLQQAADPANWPEGITYDPEDDGTPLGSLGVHEHWNSALERQYTRNLGSPTGIELITLPSSIAEWSPFVAPEAPAPPEIDGSYDDEVWKTANWYPIDQVWIPYGGSVPEDDFKGSFKVMWSSEENLLYYLVVINDDVFVDDYVYPDAGYPNFDIVEVFIDEDKSGGKHVFDVSSTGENAENAFSYHIAADAPAEGEVTNTKYVLDIDGTSWSDRTIPNYADHFPEFALTKSGNQFIYEFSMKVYDDTYEGTDPGASRVILQTGKVMGMSVAYCDNDTPGTERDNFFGSVWVTEDRYNSHWEEASDYGKLTLVGAGEAVISGFIPTRVNEFENSVVCYPNPVTGNNLNVRFDDPGQGDVDVRLFSTNGQLVKNLRKYKPAGEFNLSMNLSELEKGFYFLELRYKNKRAVKKISR